MHAAINFLKRKHSTYVDQKAEQLLYPWMMVSNDDGFQTIILVLKSIRFAVTLSRDITSYIYLHIVINLIVVDTSHLSLLTCDTDP